VGNGRSVHVLSRSAAFAARGHAVRLVTLGPVLPAVGLEVRTRPMPATPLQAVAAARSFLADLRSFEPDLLHLHYAGGKLGTMATLSGIRPFVVTVMGGDVLPEQHPGGLSRLERRATRRILERADLVLVKSNALRPVVEALGPLPGRIETVRWGVDPDRFRHDPEAEAGLRERLGLLSTDVPLLSPRILGPLYNTHLLVDAMPAILERVPHAVLLLTEYNATPGYRELLEQRIAPLGLRDRVRFVGAVGAADMPALYAVAAVAVMVPSSDGLPQSLFEAMASGTPVVLGRLSGYTEVVSDGGTAVLCDFTPPSIAEAVLRLLTDEPFRKGVATRALARVAECAFLPREIARVEAFYQELLASPNRRPPPGRLLDALGLFFR